MEGRKRDRKNGRRMEMMEESLWADQQKTEELLAQIEEMRKTIREINESYKLAHENCKQANICSVIAIVIALAAIIFRIVVALTM